MKHLDDEQTATAVAGLELDRDGRDHLSSCVDCRRKVEAMRDLIEARRLLMEGDEPDWSAQRDAVLMRLRSEPTRSGARRRSWWRPAMAAAAALAVVAVVGLIGPRSTEIASNGQELPVAEILAEMDALLADDSIPGFEIIDPGVDGLEGVLANGSS